MYYKDTLHEFISLWSVYTKMGSYDITMNAFQSTITAMPHCRVDSYMLSMMICSVYPSSCNWFSYAGNKIVWLNNFGGIINTVAIHFPYTYEQSIIKLHTFIYVTGFGKTDQCVTIDISRNTDLTY